MIDATKLLRLFAMRRLSVLSRMDPVQAQRTTLLGLLRQAATTRFGRDHGFAGLDTVEAYQQAVPLRTYEAFWHDYWQTAFPNLDAVTWPGRIGSFALSSGTTGGPTKYIPVSRVMIRCNTQAAFDTMAFHLAARPQSRVLGGVSVILGGSTALEQLAPGVTAGDLSGIAALHMPAWTRLRAFPPPRIALMSDWAAKTDALVEAVLGDGSGRMLDIRSISGTPSWMLLFFEQLAARRPQLGRRLAGLFPNLELIVHGGVAFTPYQDSMAAWLEGSHAETREVYAASEGFIAAADRGPGEGMRLVLDRGLFFEFVRPDQLDAPNPDRRWLATAETGVEYALIVSSNAGLWSFVIGDTVVLTERDPPRVMITGRTSFTLSAFGEHLIVQEMDQAATEAARALGTAVVDYAAAAVYPDAERSRGGHVFIVELAAFRPERAADFAATLDTALLQLNADYAAHRQGDFGMAPPEVVLVRPGMFAAWMRHRGRLGGQNKVPRVINDPGMLADLRGFVASEDTQEVKQ